MRYFDDEVGELQALEWHSLSLYTCAWTIYQCLNKINIELCFNKLNTLQKKKQCTHNHIKLLKTHPVLVNYIHNYHQFALIRTECNEGNAANFDKALEHLKKKKKKDKDALTLRQPHKNRKLYHISPTVKINRNTRFNQFTLINVQVLRNITIKQSSSTKPVMHSYERH